MAPLYLLDSTHKLATTPPFFWSTVICTYVSCSSPIAAAASKRLFQIFFGIISAYLAYQNGVSVEEDKVYNHYIYKEVKIYPISLRDGSEPGLKSSFLDFGLLRDRCVIPPSGQSWKNGTLEVLFPTRLVWFGLVKCCQRGLGHSAQTFIFMFQFPSSFPLHSWSWLLSNFYFSSHKLYWQLRDVWYLMPVKLWLGTPSIKVHWGMIVHSSLSLISPEN